jgi:hypothetical protein
MTDVALQVLVRSIEQYWINRLDRMRRALSAYGGTTVPGRRYQQGDPGAVGAEGHPRGSCRPTPMTSPLKSSIRTTEPVALPRLRHNQYLGVQCAQKGPSQTPHNCATLYDDVGQQQRHPRRCPEMFDELRQTLPLRYKNAENERQRQKIEWMCDYVNDTIVEQNLPTDWKVVLPQWRQS